MIFKPAPREVPVHHGRIRSGAGATIVLVLTRRVARIIAATAHSRAAAIFVAIVVLSLILALVTLWLLLAAWLLIFIVLVGVVSRSPQLIRSKTRSCWRSVWVYRRRWGKLLTASGVVSTTDPVLPMVYRIESTGDDGAMDVIRLGLRSSGKTRADFQGAAESMYRMVKALDCRCYDVDGRSNQLDLKFMIKDPLVNHPFEPFPPPRTAADAIRELTEEGLLILVDEDLEPERLPVNYHLLVGGETGSGKTNIELAIMDRLYPAYAEGLVQFWGVDTKGKDLPIAEHLFTEFVRGDRKNPARHEQQVVQFLERGVRESGLRAEAMVGQDRFVPTTELPYLVMFLDDITELASQAITPAIRRRMKAAVNTIVGDGRVLGVMVVAVCNHPGLEVVPFRRGFPSKSALRLDSPDQLRMLYGWDAHKDGVRADKIPKHEGGNGITYLLKPGVGWKRCRYVSIRPQRVAGYHPRPGGNHSLVEAQKLAMKTRARKPRYGGFDT